ncbi:MAG: squalene--hopene cyclase [Acidobacteria bacterium]|nr:squalene--hopene cyclase [Acidobacteriota bacterium]
MTIVERSGHATATAVAASPLTPSRLAASIHDATQFLLECQREDGHWAGELEADTTLESDYILLQLWLHPPDAAGRWNPPSAERVRKAARYILSKQTGTGGWNIFHEGPDNISATVKAYFALKLTALPGTEIVLAKARRRILELGGVEAANSYTKIYLSYFGLFDREKTPTIPPEVFLLRETSKVNIYEISSWSRAILAPLAILGAKRASRRPPAGFTLGEIFSGIEPPKPNLVSWKSFFLWADFSLKIWEKLGINGLRAKAIDAAAQWMIERLESSDGLAAIFPAMMNSIMALTELGYGLDHPLVQREVERFEQLIIEDEETLRMQPCHSPVWDTAISAFAIGRAHPSPTPEVRRSLEAAGDWLLSKEVTQPGDWIVKNPGVEPGGWYFEYENEFYPDCDDTAKVLLALEQARPSDRARHRAARDRAMAWLASMQCADGGWAAFDRDNDSEILTHVPFADHNAMLDPSCPDITGRAIEALSGPGAERYRLNVLRGMDYLRSSQKEDGSWFGRWGVNYVYGTCFALRGLRAAGEDPREAHVIQAGEWLRSIQNADGGWGELCASYDDPSAKFGGPSTPSQTAWALLGLFATEDFQSGSIESGVRYLLDSQNEDGSWDEELWTGTGFPSVFYLRYHLYRQYFPLLALGEYARAVTRD